MVIELCGVPGGGKSTLARAYLMAHPEAQAVSLDMYNKLPTLWYAGLFALLRPAAFLSLAGFVIQHHARGLFRYSFHLMLRACAKWQKAGKAREDATLIDEGLFHILAVLPRHAIRKEEMGRLIRVLPWPSAICISGEGTFHRFHNEQAMKHPRVQAGQDSLRSWEEAVRMNVATLRTCLEDMKLPVFVIPQEDGVGALRVFLKTV